MDIHEVERIKNRGILGRPDEPRTVTIIGVVAAQVVVVADVMQPTRAWNE